MEFDENWPPESSGPSLFPNEIVRIANYCAEEVKRQGRFTPQVGNMIEAWMDALNHQYHGDSLSLGMIRNWGCLIEPTQNRGFRTGDVYISDFGVAIRKTSPERILSRFERFFDNLEDMEALDAYREFEEIHPFWDGNGRTGKIILNWLNGTLLDPIFPPEDFWGRRITNP
jgi:hypothetical protein